MNNFSFNTPGSIRFGAGMLNQIGEIVRSIAANKVLLVTDQGMLRTGIVELARQYLDICGIKTCIYDKVTADPPENNILDATRLARDEQVDAVLGLGGGSSLDVAKLVALLAAGNERLADIYGVGKAKGPRLPLILVPTTSGTGSEVTPISIVTTGKHEKMGVVSPVLLPDIAVLDPELTIGLPANITAATGIDAIVHAIEAFASASPNNNPISQTLAKKALGLMCPALLLAVKDGSNLAARSDMLLGSMLAGQAFANSPVAAVHALAYPLGGHFHIPHGLSNALLLPHVLRFNVETAPEPYAELAPFAFPDLVDYGEEDRASGFIDRLVALSTGCGLPQTLRDMDVPESFLPRLAEDAMRQTRLLVNNPRSVALKDAVAIYQNAY